VRFSEERIAQGQQLANKLWNASRLVLLGVGADARAAVVSGAVEDRWITSRLARAKHDVAERVERYEFSHAALRLYDFVYGELCDWYLELVKPRLRSGEPQLAATLLYVLTETLVLAHPLIPFVTEEIYAHVPGAEGLLAGRQVEASPPPDETAERALRQVIEAVQALRGWREKLDVNVGATVAARLAATGYEDTAEHVARLARVSFSDDGGESVASVPVPGGTIEILPSADVDLDEAERKRAAERTRLEAEIERAQLKLSNDGFVAKAPAHVVQAEREKLAQLEAELQAL
jgi:valyl-tRNA synthetase